MGVTLQDIGKKTGVHAGTVSRALRGDSRVNSETKARILKECQRLGYVPNITARNLVTRRTDAVLFVMCTLKTPHEVEPAIVINQLCAQNDLKALMMMHDETPELFRRILELIRQNIADGAIIIAPSFTVMADAEVQAAFRKLSVPVVFLDRAPRNCPQTVVTTDNAAATRELLERGLAGHDYDGAVFISNADNSVGVVRNATATEILRRRNLPYVENGENIPDTWQKVLVFSNSGDNGNRLAAQMRAAGRKWHDCVLLTFDAVSTMLDAAYWGGYFCQQDFPGLARCAFEQLQKEITEKKQSRRYEFPCKGIEFVGNRI